MSASERAEWRTQCAVGRDGILVVDPDAVIGPYAIHGRIKDGAASGPGWTITHRSTGKAVWHVLEYADAIKVAQWLDNERVMPESREEAFTWIAKRLPSEQTKLMVQLQHIAPRHIPA